MTFVDLLNHPDYEIMNEYPFTIRRKKDQSVVSETTTNGYVVLRLKRKIYYKHRLIALQFIPNEDPENKTEVDHINKNRLDYHITNLRWVSTKENMLNRTSYNHVACVYVDDLPEETTMVDFYDTRNGRRIFKEHQYYYLHDEHNGSDDFYIRINDGYYRKLNVNYNICNNAYVNLRDIDDRPVQMLIHTFKRQHDID